MKITPMAREHGLAAFDCGEPDLNEWLFKYAGQNQRRHMSKTQVAISNDGISVAGYVTTSLTTVDDQTDETGNRSIPVFLIARLAVDLKFQGLGIGSHLVEHALQNAISVDKLTGVHSVMVHLKSAKLMPFYANFGFLPVGGDGLLVSMRIAKLLISKG
jgi:predicted N-acetyltransferase YhbS